MLKKGIVMLMLFKLNLNLNLSLNIGELTGLSCASQRTILCTISNLLRCIQSIILKPSNLFNILIRFI